MRATLLGLSLLNLAISNCDSDSESFTFASLCFPETTAVTVRRSINTLVARCVVIGTQSDATFETARYCAIQRQATRGLSPCVSGTSGQTIIMATESERLVLGEGTH